MDWPERMELNPEVLTGKPAVKDCPTLTPDDIPACLQYASATVHAGSV